jgi:putative ABC transport system permease protein
VSTYDKFLARLASMPGLQAVSAVMPLPMSGFHPIADYGIAGRHILKVDLPRSEPHVVARNYFQTMEIPVTRGRDFDERDQRDAPPVVIINETLAHASFPGENPIGKRITPGMTDNGIIREREIVGVVADVTCDSLRAKPMPEVYLPHAQCSAGALVLVARGDVDAEAFYAVLRDVAAKVAPDLAIEQPRTMDQYLGASVAQPRLNSTLLATFAFVAVVLTAIGVYGVMAYSVAQRRHEIGIRLALGAQKMAVFRLVIGQGLRLIACSVLAGVACTALISPMLQRFGHGIGTGQAATIAFVALLLSAVACLACWLPAQRASAEDPLAAIGQR